MTDEQTKKYLKELLEVMLNDGDLQGASTISHAIDLIKRQQAESDRQKSMNQAKLDTIHDLRAEIEVLNKTIDNYVSCLENIEKIKAKAYKEFAERLKEVYTLHEGLHIEIDNLVKELTEVKDDEN